MQSKLPTAVLCGFLLMALAACGGNDGARITELEADLAAAEEALTEAEAEAEAEAAEAERLRLAEEAAREQAEEETRQAELEAQQAEADRLAAQQAAEEAEAQRQAAEAERQRLAAEAEERRKADATEAARVAITGARNIGTTDPAGLLVGAIRYGDPAPVTAPPGPFTTTTSRSGQWSITGHTDRREATRHTIEIYSDVEAPKNEPFRTSDYNTDNDDSSVVIDGTGKVVGHVDIENATGGDDRHSRIAASGVFPRDIGLPKPFSLLDKGLTQTEYGSGPTDSDGNGTISDAELEVFTPSITRQQYNQYRADRGFRDTDVFPQRYAYTTNGTLQGAGGTYRCSGADTAATCTVQNRGGSFEFGGTGDWDFIPSSGTVTIIVPDGQYMWFGWWAEQTVEHTVTPDGEHTTDIWKFEANHGGNAVTGVGDATGTATYRGPAAGRYAVYEPDTGDSGIGSFTASATLQADFDAATNTVSGTITGFSNDPSWSLALKQGNVDGGNVGVETDGVTWTIDGIPDDSGAWEATFYSNLPLVDDEGTADTTVDYQPHGIAGTFEAAYDPSGAGPRAAVIGGFGAHR